MTDFTNTIDVVGDEALSDSIIERTITEFKDDHVLTVGHGAFYYCTALTTVDLPEATKLDGSSFAECASLASVSLPKVQTIRGQIVRGVKTPMPITPSGSAAHAEKPEMHSVRIKIFRSQC